MNYTLLSRPQAATYLGVKPNTLAVWQSTKRYRIPYIKVGRLVKYHKADLDAFLQQRTIGGANA